MELFFDRVQVCLSTNDDTLERVLSHYFRDWLRLQNDYGHIGQAPCRQAPTKKKTINFRLDLVQNITKTPVSRLLFGGSPADDQSTGSDVAVFHDLDSFWIRFNDGAIVKLPIVAEPGPVEIWGQVTPGLIGSGRLEDVFYTALAPILRRWGYVMLHAFGAVSPRGKAVLLVGPSNSGKTTSGLSLLLANWKFLSNDVVLIRKKGDMVVAFPFPSGIGLTLQTLELLPELGERFELPVNQASDKKLPFPLHLVAKGWSEPAQVQVVCFPRIEVAAQTRLERCGRAIAVARLAEHSVDRWDRAYLEDSVGQLAALSRQADSYDLHLGQNLAQLAEELVAAI